MDVKYKYLPHTADVEFAAYGKNVKTALSNAGEALLNVMLDLKEIKKRKVASGSVAINESASNIEDLVWFVLQDVLTRVDDKKLLAYELKVNELKQGGDGKFRARCKLIFKKLEEDLFLLEVKAVTPNGLTVKKSEKGYEIKVIIDV
jgi:SHS2 domain-containing protein